VGFSFRHHLMGFRYTNGIHQSLKHSCWRTRGLSLSLEII
jgi:hypothetical protein